MLVLSRSFEVDTSVRVRHRSPRNLVETLDVTTALDAAAASLVIDSFLTGMPDGNSETIDIGHFGEAPANRQSVARIGERALEYMERLQQNRTPDEPLFGGDDLTLFTAINVELTRTGPLAKAKAHRRELLARYQQEAVGESAVGLPPRTAELDAIVVPVVAKAFDNTIVRLEQDGYRAAVDLSCRAFAPLSGSRGLLYPLGLLHTDVPETYLSHQIVRRNASTSTITTITQGELGALVPHGQGSRANRR